MRGKHEAERSGGICFSMLIGALKGSEAPRKQTTRGATAAAVASKLFGVQRHKAT